MVSVVAKCSSEYFPQPLSEKAKYLEVMILPAAWKGINEMARPLSPFGKRAKARVKDNVLV